MTSHCILHLEGLKINLESQFPKTPYPSQNSVVHPSFEQSSPLTLSIMIIHLCIFALECREVKLLWYEIFFIPYVANPQVNEMTKIALSDAGKWELWYGKEQHLLFEPKIQGELKALALHQWGIIISWVAASCLFERHHPLGFCRVFSGMFSL